MTNELESAVIRNNVLYKFILLLTLQVYKSSLLRYVDLKITHF